ncbi:prevent-host-death family protein [Microbacterium aurum]|uniref:Prevent-host-death family protein n=1 Tax=Microbacterium aurum TaxID=36805 RepID=A0A1P8U7H0_9MICO|nr:type II toxin-antitoxin system prevent-host-death family antitoxin [Microbacterium aurum]APZ34062.1 prevent-host-death family protein [Microbacterium aurum]MBM7827854.1 prevent-host-death family protein [Microbacterium aurum]
MSAGEPQIESLSQRELRNESGRVLREVGEGHSFVLTNRGIPVGRIVPLDAPSPTLPIVRHAKRVGGWAALKPAGAENDRPMTQIIDELREDRA